MADNPEKDIDVLTAALNERYEALRVIRERVQSTGIWALGLMFGAAGWLIQSDAIFARPEKLLAICGVLAGLAVLRFSYLADLEKGFRSQQLVAARIETALGLYDRTRFGDGETSLYPKEWKSAGSSKGGGKFFNSTYLLLLVGGGFLLAAIVFAA